MERWVKAEPNVSVFVQDINPRGRKTILFLHGWPADHRLFEYQYQDLLEKGYRCVGPDMRGFGRSEKPVSGYDYNRLADDVRRIIDSMGLCGVTLAGHSTGGAVALRYVARHNAHGVSKLVLIAAAAPSLIQRPDFPYGLERADVERIIAETRRNRPDMLRNFQEMFFYRKVSPSFAQWFFQLGIGAAGWSTIAVSQSWLKEELFSDMARVRIPTLILHGVHDQVCLFPLGEALSRGIAGSRLIPFEESGHGLFYDEREKFNKELIRFAG